MESGIAEVDRKENEQYDADGLYEIRLYLLIEIVEHRREEISESNSRESEYEQSLKADPAVDVKEITRLVPPLGVE